MSDDTIIRIEGLWKRYGLPLPGIIKKGINRLHAIRNPWPRPGLQAKQAVPSTPRRGGPQSLAQSAPGRAAGHNINDGPWALRDIDLEVKRGETLGIIGRNGAGKSTLLKVLAGVTPPTRGKVEVRGRVFPMIELNAGLHMELTGRENVSLLGAIMGLSRREIETKMPQIEEFCELGEWFDRPVRKYSSGMLARLGFGVALNVEADILLIDEVLAVGDMNFQRKCVERIANMQNSSVTILLVTHAVRQAERVCQKGILLDEGTIISSNAMREVASEYYRTAIQRELMRVKTQANPTIYLDTREISFEAIEIRDASGEASDSVETGKAMSIYLRFRLREHIEDLIFHFGFVTSDMLRVTIFNSIDEPFPQTYEGQGIVECRIEKLALMPGTYGLFVSVTRANNVSLFKGENLVVFQVVDPAFSYIRRNMELVAFDVEWKFSSVESSDESESETSEVIC